MNLMAGYRDDPGDNNEVSGDSGRGNLKATRAYGCLFAALMALGMSFVIFVGNVMGDCEPGPGCHDKDGVHILQDLALALPIATLLGIGMWLLAAALRAILRPMILEPAVGVLLVGLTLVLVWVCFDPAFETFFRLTTPAQP